MVLSILWSPAVVQAEAEYLSLPKLDGKIDSSAAQNVARPDLKSENNVNAEQAAEQTLPSSSSENEKQISSSSESLTETASTIGIGSPKLDVPDTPVKADVISDNIRFKNYKNDLNYIIKLLVDLGGNIEIGTTIQLFSAKTHDIMMQNELFKNKYSGKTESQLESYRLVQKVVSTANYTKTFWFESNKMKQNLRGVPDQIIQTKLLQIVSDVDQLLELQKIDKSLTQE